MAKKTTRDEILLTTEGKAKMEARLRELVEVERRKVAEEIAVARDFGDLKENTQYSQAKDRQAEIEDEIRQIQDTLRHAKIIHDERGGIVRIGSTVTIKKLKKGEAKVTDAEDETFSIVGAMEADPFAGKISNESPLGAALLDRAVGDEVSFSAPAGEFTYKILKIS